MHEQNPCGKSIKHSGTLMPSQGVVPTRCLLFPCCLCHWGRTWIQCRFCLSLPWFYQRIRLTEIHRTDINFLESQFWCYIPSEGLHTWNVMEVSPSFRQMGPVGAPAHRGGCCWLFAESTKEKSGDLSKPKTFTNSVQSSLFWLFNWHDLIWMSFVQTNLGDLF